MKIRKYWHQFELREDGTVEELKRCGSCKIWKPVELFYKRKTLHTWDGLTAYCKPCSVARTTHYHKTHPEWNIRNREKKRQEARELRDRLFVLLGGKVCNVCGYSDERALCFDHKNADGFLDRKHGKSPVRIWQEALLEPERFQVLCMNCNWKKAKEEDPVRREEVHKKLLEEDTGTLSEFVEIEPYAYLGNV